LIRFPKDTHPDKRKDIPEEEAAKEFHKIVHAFEILSDETSRRIYDRTGSHTHQQQQQGNSRSWNNNYYYFWQGGVYSNRRRRFKLKDRFDVKQAMSRVMHIVSLSQLETLMLDDDGLLERNLLMCFVTPDMESIANDDMVFPYPFAHMSKQGYDGYLFLYEIGLLCIPVFAFSHDFFLVFLLSHFVAFGGKTFFKQYK
jgi:curved DNA-binding protein CbpA